MKSNRAFLVLSIVFLMLAAALSVTIWSHVSLAAKIAFFAFGFASGIATGRWIAMRSKQ